VDYFDYDEFADIDIEHLLEQSREIEEQLLENHLLRIDEQLEKRERLHEDILDELESKKGWYIERLETLYKQSRAREKREQLKSKIEDLYQEIRDEKRQNWLDQRDLEQERRDILRELEDLTTDDLISDLLKHL
jgi:hypothetical protein